MYNEPGNESAELGGREEIHFKHGHRVRTYRLFPEFVDAELGDFGLSDMGDRQERGEGDRHILSESVPIILVRTSFARRSFRSSRYGCH